ncbi:DUF4136 domain-containing protein [Flavisolibacter tropicus]|uniref:DUF4136 domain-containing protein n=1 Tax=Flavisolibacter tropicus TaxID=1492898 RepID=A0A172TQ57_9BACT|nr:DUF4136 domain-containing protein [Flavisolibacter tropicus]ANE49209.1 hypothetical protein SY85_00505 [Flavisolibacter tropicus]
MTAKLYKCLALIVIVLLAGCYPEGAQYTEELDLVYTNYYNQFDFKSQKTFAIPDSVVKITGDAFTDPDGDGKPQFANPTYSAAVLNKLKENMAANGWTLVNKNNNPDVVLLVSAMTTTNIYYYYDWWYWDWWYGGWYGWYYPGWYYPPYVTGYRSGSIFIQMAQLKGLRTGDNATVAWNCIINGLAEGGTADITARIQTSVDKAFAQSPYLKIN